jgi:hypothetical protein
VNPFVWRATSLRNSVAVVRNSKPPSPFGAGLGCKVLSVSPISRYMNEHSIGDLYIAIRQAAELLPQGSSITLTREAILGQLVEPNLPVLQMTKPAPQQDRLLDAKDVASILKCKPRFVYSSAHSWPFTKRIGRNVRFSEMGLQKWLRDQKGCANN